jgi:4a-hydroxytetrahydrobiopterin dehydratase
MSEKHCKACHAGMPTLEANVIEEKLKSFSGWVHDEENNCLEKTFNFKTYGKTMAFVNAVAWIATQEKHHPDLKVSYNKVIVSYQTHEAGGITENDFICVEKIQLLGAD